MSPATGGLIIMVLQFGFAVMLAPTILNARAQVPRTSSVPTAIGLWIMTATFAAMQSWTAAAGSAFCATGWTIVAACRPVRGARWGE